MLSFSECSKTLANTFNLLGSFFNTCLKSSESSNVSILSTYVHIVFVGTSCLLYNDEVCIKERNM